MKNNTEFLEKETSNRFQDVRKVLLWVLIANLAVTLVKIIVGIATGSLTKCRPRASAPRLTA